MSHFMSHVRWHRAERPCPAEKEYIVVDLVTAYKIHTQTINAYEMLDVYRLRFEDQFFLPHTIMLYVVTDCDGKEYCLFRDETNEREYHLV
jgi:hypothetical protein